MTTRTLIITPRVGTGTVAVRFTEQAGRLRVSRNDGRPVRLTPFVKLESDPRTLAVHAVHALDIENMENGIRVPMAVKSAAWETTFTEHHQVTLAV